MAHFAKIENGLVAEVLVVPNEQEHRGQEYLNELGIEGVWIQTSYTNKIRKQFAAIGMSYNAEADVFIIKQPHASWSLDSNFDWVAPIPEPEDDNQYDWNEETLSWVLQTSE